MDVPVRALSWAVRFFWIITLAFAITCVYSATLIRAEFGEPIAGTSEEEFTIALPIMFYNNGYYSISDFNVTTIIADSENSPFSQSSSYMTQIPAQNNATIFHNVSFNLNELTTRESYLFNDSSLVLFGAIRLTYAGLIPFMVEMNKSVPWGAPLANFAIGTPEYSAYNVTSLRVVIPISFENHSPYFSVIGNIRIEILNERHELFGESAVFVDVPSNTNYDGEIEMFVNPADMSARGQLQVYFETEIFNYGPLVMNFG